MEQLLQASVGMISGDREEKLSTGKRPLYFEGKIFAGPVFTLRATYPYLANPLPPRHPWGPVPSAAKVKPPAIFKQAIERNSDGSRF